MKKLSIVFLFVLLSSFSSTVGAELPNRPTPFPIFLKFGFSAVIEFEEPPTRVVLGDSQTFQVERLDRSLVVRTLAAYGTSNMFVYFKSAAPRLFILTASEDAEPTFFTKIALPFAAGVPAPAAKRDFAGVRVLKSQVTSAQFSPKKDYLTVEASIAADATGIIRPKWDLVRLKHQVNTISPTRLWSERKEVQRDSFIMSRFIFAKPNIPQNLVGTVLIIPIEGNANPLVLPLKRSAR